MIHSTGDEPWSSPPVPLGYLVSQYPTVSHTFILREIRTLRALGFDVRVVSIRQPDRSPDQLSPEEAEELRLTFSVLGGGLLRILRAHLRCCGARWPMPPRSGMPSGWEAGTFAGRRPT
jgi:hypothetical protein